MIELDHLRVELSGKCLVEASAGTGKTFAIAFLYLRLLLEKDLTPEQILVVTFTEAATEELRARIRARIVEAVRVFEGAPADDPLLGALCGNVTGSCPDRDSSLDILRRALSSFDTASVFTIHGFCLRALRDNAFESGSLYDTELATDQSGMLREIADDFWRTRFFRQPAPLLGYALARGYTPDSLFAFLREVSTDPLQEIRPSYSAEAIAAIEERCRAAFDGIRGLWSSCRGEVEEILLHHPGLSRAADNYRRDAIPPLIDSMASFAAGDNPFDLFKGFEKFCGGTMDGQSLKKHPPPRHALFDRCDDLLRGVEERFLALRWELVRFSREQLASRKRSGNVRFFDDLIRDLYTALRGENGEALAASLGNRYRAALIDEFQDTDPVQYDIFRAVFSRPGMTLCLIADPKQAIYSFRGADIFAYMKAAGDVEENRRYTLTDNYRSTPLLLDAFNRVFQDSRRPFVYDAIAYHPVRPGTGKGGKELLVEGSDHAPLRLWLLPARDGTPPSVGEANEAVPAAVAAEISRLLREGTEGKALIGGRPVSPEDIAVLVRDHRQAAAIQESLRKLSIPGVMRSDSSIFSTDEAREVCTLIGAIADPGSEHRVRAALVSDLLGRNGDDIARLLEREQEWEECLERFRDYHQTWLDQGFMVMARSLTAREGVRGRLLRRPDGERRMTNLLHCFEVIHQAAHEKGNGIEGLLTWFGERVVAGDQAEEYQIRLETDEKAVKILTVHISKGLQYGIVFCPFLWGGLRESGEVAAFHEGFRMVRDFGSPEFDRNRTRARREALAESLRLLYVALTRAKYRCYLAAGKVVGKTAKNRPETSPLSYLFHASGETRSAEDVVRRLEEELGGRTATEMEERLREIADGSEGAISLEPMPAPGDALPYAPGRDRGGPLSCRTFSGEISRDWRVTSFTAFTARDGGPMPELPDRDETAGGDGATAPAPTGDEPRERSIFTFPRGARAGIFLHGIFEEIDFSRAEPDRVRALVEAGLERHGYDREWLPHICSLVDNVLKTPLPSPGGRFSLADLKQGSWLTELEFFFPLRFITSDTLRDVLRSWGEDYGAADLLHLCRNLRFRPVRGMVRGFMDMVFEQGGRYYLADWKSNHLGYRMEDYGRESLRDEMARNLYPLQYLLYTVALNRYLSLRVRGYDYGSRFGGVFYLFLRGIGPGRDGEYGIFRDTPPAGMIEELTRCLIGTGG